MSGHEETHDAALNQSENSFFFIDSYGTRPQTESGIVADGYINVSRYGVLSDPDSSGDEVVFSGRQNSRNNVAAEPARVKSPSPVPQVAVQVIEDDIQFMTQLQAEWTRSGDSPVPEKTELEEDTYISLLANKRTRNKRKGKGKKKISARKEQSIVFSDYVKNVTRHEMSTEVLGDDDDDVSADEWGLSSKDKAKFRALSTLDTVGESSKQASGKSNDDDEDTSENDSDSTDDSSALDEIISQIRRGGSFAMLDDDISLDDVENYVDFDLIDMQQDGPLKKKKKKKGRQMDFGLSDSDLELHLEQAWQKDRNKKKAKKREREQLRAEGLLGKKSKKPDARSKDKGGFGIEGVKVELRSFLQSQSDSLDLPPMKKHHRRLVHELANALALKSQSRGKGNSRFPVLYKTGRTPNFNGKHSVNLDKIFAQPRFNRQSSTRMGPNERESAAPKNPRRPTNTAASYLEGEVVGGSAPEIGAGNKGRAMLEKMGWSSGTALGALNNKGILQPVAHVVKNTRAGLG